MHHKAFDAYAAGFFDKRALYVGGDKTRLMINCRNVYSVAERQVKRADFYSGLIGIFPKLRPIDIGKMLPASAQLNRGNAAVGVVLERFLIGADR